MERKLKENQLHNNKRKKLRGWVLYFAAVLTGFIAIVFLMVMILNYYTAKIIFMMDSEVYLWIFASILFLGLSVIILKANISERIRNLLTILACVPYLIVCELISMNTMAEIIEINEGLLNHHLGNSFWSSVGVFFVVSYFFRRCAKTKNATKSVNSELLDNW
ncbi:hypothetical protein [Parvicella tangerina]|uniref:Uncharacterized protein n=1 Tax=Parvicella tangerina TaxID=2829795 RepID=A0A916JQR2_9FLAO|nr:hypothetical protein [Parvicella tangerina]CAG5087380.1 hypothetical protein CRYO30217_03468 [Parvicella tangerina]